MRSILILATCCLIIGFGAISSFAHHSIYAEFDMDHPHSWTGVITEVDWGNPHAWVYLDIKDAQTAKTRMWALQLPSPNLLGKRGWGRELLKSGDSIVVNGNLAKDGSRKGLIREIKLMDGRKLIVTP